MSASSTQTLSLNLDISAPDSFHILPDNRASITFRCLQPGDQPEVKSLCHAWFPVEYPDTWYDDIAHNKKYFTLAACDRSTHAIVGLIVANVLLFAHCNYDDQKILHPSLSLNSSICYILVLGVVKEYRRQGLASLLLDNLIQTFDQRSTCKAIYLHVLHSNRQAIEFYRSKQFQYRVHLPSYYMINGDYFDAFCFARYINGKQRMNVSSRALLIDVLTT